MERKYSVHKAEIVVGFECNNNCLFCSIPFRSSHLSTEEILKKIDEVADEVLEVHFTGGEPSIRRDIFDIVEYANSKGVPFIRMTTNGRMFSYDWFTSKIVDAGLSGAIFSLHSHLPEIHDYLVAVPGAWEQEIMGIENLGDFVNWNGINITITRPMQDKLVEFAEFILRFNIGRVTLIVPEIEGKMRNSYVRLMPDLHVLAKEIPKALQVLYDAGIVGWVANYPPCMLRDQGAAVSCTYDTDMLWPSGERAYLQEKKISEYEYLPQCAQCAYRSVCIGVPKDFLRNGWVSPSDIIPYDKSPRYMGPSPWYV